MELGVRHLRDVLQPVISGEVDSLPDEAFLLATYIDDTIGYDAAISVPDERPQALEKMIVIVPLDELLGRWQKLEAVLDDLANELDLNAEQR